MMDEKGQVIDRSGFIYNGDTNLEWPLSFNILAKCSTTKARTSILKLPHYEVETPIFMPVGTQGTMKGLTTDQLENLNCQIILGNTYHLGMRPVCLVFHFASFVLNGFCWVVSFERTTERQVRRRVDGCKKRVDSSVQMYTLVIIVHFKCAKIY